LQNFFWRKWDLCIVWHAAQLVAQILRQGRCCRHYGTDGTYLRVGHHLHRTAYAACGSNSSASGVTLP
jgi:hypothetical protein